MLWNTSNISGQKVTRQIFYNIGYALTNMVWECQSGSDVQLLPIAAVFITVK